MLTSQSKCDNSRSLFLLAKLKRYALLMRMHRPIGTLLLLWPTLWALWVAAAGKPSLKNIVLFTIGVFLMRSAGCVINDYADRNFDHAVERTKNRPLATGQVTATEALVVFFVLLVFALVVVLFLNLLTIKLAIAASFLTVLYPYTKRFLDTPQLVLGLAFAWGVPMAFAAEINALPLTCWLLFFSAVMWPIAYDTMYAMVDRRDDEVIGIRSTAIFFGRYDRIFIAFIQGLFLLSLILLGNMLQLPIIYYVSLGSTLLLFVYQQYLLRTRNPSDCFKAFNNNHWVGLLIFLGLVLSLKM